MRPAPYSFTWEPVFVVLAVVCLVLYLRRARVEPPGAGRTALFVLGAVLIVAALNSPLETLSAHYLVLIHLLQNALIADVAPPLVLLGLTPAFRAALVRRGGRPLRLLTRPVVALPTWLVAWYGIHLPFVYDTTLRHGWPLNVEHAVLIAAGLVFWWPVLVPESEQLSAPAILAYLAIAFGGSAFLGLALTFSTTAFYSFYTDVPRLWGLSPVKDQNFGGVLMTAEQTIVFLAALGYFLMRLLDEEDEAQRALERPPGEALSR